MEAIKLPVKYDAADGNLWNIKDADGNIIARNLAPGIADEIIRRLNSEGCEPDWLPLDEAPAEKIVELLVQDRIGVSGPPPKKVTVGFFERGKWRECTTSGNYVMHQNIIAYRLLPTPPSIGDRT